MTIRRARAGRSSSSTAPRIPETLVESELFGHERGAFSDARERKLGLVEVADGARCSSTRSAISVVRPGEALTF